MPVVPNVSIHHVIDADIRRDDAANRQKSPTPHDDVEAPTSQLSFRVVNEESGQASRDNCPTIQINQDNTTNRRNALAQVERINWKTHAATIIASNIARKPLSFTQRKRKFTTMSKESMIA